VRRVVVLNRDGEALASRVAGSAGHLHHSLAGLTWPPRPLESVLRSGRLRGQHQKKLTCAL
jgi:hypothetical protein